MAKNLVEKNSKLAKQNIGKAIERLKQGKVIAWKDRNNNNNNNNNMVINSNNENIISSIP